MRKRFFLIPSLAIASALLFDSSAQSADCLDCGQPAYDGYISQPTLVVRHPLALLQPYYVTDYIPCGKGDLVNQGQYHTKAETIPESSCHNPPPCNPCR